MTSSGSFKLTLVNTQSSTPPKEFELIKSEIVIGRDEGVDIVIATPAVSRRHARLMLEGDAYAIEDLGSSNGTFVNGDRLIGRRKLQHGDEVRLGQAITLNYSAPVEEEEGKTAVRPATPMPAAPSHVMQTTIGEEVSLPVASGPRQLIVTIAGENPKSYSLTRTSYSIGRLDDNDVVIASPIVSGHHARIEQASGGGYKLTVLPEARNPVLYEGRPFEGSRVLRHGDLLRIGSQDPGVMVTLTYEAPAEAAAQVERDIVFGEKSLIQIGRDPSNDVVLPSPNISRFHAQVQRVGQRYRVEDLRSSNGVFVNDEKVDGSLWLKPNDTVRVGQYRFVLGKDQLAQFDDSNGLKVDVVGLNKWVRKDLNILQNISVAFKPREFIVVVGQSGGGKSTFVDAVAGYRPATPPSKVYVNDTDIYTHFDSIRNEIGFVPQKDIIHMELTVYQALDYAAQLRMPGDTSPEERHKRVMEVLADLDLTHRKDVQISGLSGGQQKRVSIGVELLTKPGLFFLDEPTSGLDPGTETALMQLMRRLADQGRTIILITHATKNVMLADKVIFLARGGYLAWFGPPDEALAYFDKYRSERDRRAGKIEFDEIYAILDDPSKGKAPEWAQRYRESRAYQEYVLGALAGKLSPEGAPTLPEPGRAPARAAGTSSKQASSLKQFMILSARNVKILTRDRFALILMLAVAPLFSIIHGLVALFVGRNLVDFNMGNMSLIMIILFLLPVYGVMVGGMSQMREIVKEQDIYKRERLVNLKILPYVMSKIWIAALLALYQAAAYTIVHTVAFKVPGGVTEFVLIYVTMALTTLAGMMFGLFASAIAPNASSAPLIVIIFLLPQIVLGGALFPMPGYVSGVTSTRWGFEALMAITGPGSDVAADVCWKLPPEVQQAMTLEDKAARGCNCMGVKMFEPGSCDFPGLGQFRPPVLDQPLLAEPAPLPPEPVRPVEPANQSDNVAMAEFFAQLQLYEVEVENYKKVIEQYQADTVAYETQQIQLEFSSGSAEALIRTFAGDVAGWTFVNKEDTPAFIGKVATTWVVQSVICLILLAAILYLQKRKDVI